MNIRKKTTQLLAKAFLALNLPEKAIALAKNALNASPGDLDFLQVLQKGYDLKRDFDNFVGVFNTFIDLMPDNFWVRRRLGDTYFRIYKYEEALTYFLDCLQNWSKGENTFGATNYDFANTHAGLGLCYLYLGQWEQAEKALKLAIEISPWDLDACYGTLLLYQGTGRVTKIPEFLDLKIQEYPTLYPLYYWKADYIQYISYQPEEALKWYQSAISRYNMKAEQYVSNFVVAGRHVSFVGIRKAYINALIECGLKEKARRVVFLYNFKDRGHFNGRFLTLIYFYIQTGKLTRAENEFSRRWWKKIDPLDKYILADIQAKQGRFDEALKTIKDFRFLPGYSHILEILGSIYMSRKNWEEATKTFLRLTQMEPFETDWLEELGHCYVETGNLELARITYERVLSMDPMDAVAWGDLGEIYSSLGLTDMAQSAYEKSLSFNRLSQEKREQSTKGKNQ
jgi:tetratricopeptide (TPR) repeat protein